MLYIDTRFNHSPGTLHDTGQYKVNNMCAQIPKRDYKII